MIFSVPKSTGTMWEKKHQNLFTVNRNDILIESMVNLLKSEFFVSVDPHFFVNHQRWFVTFFPITFWDYLIGFFEEKRASKTSPGDFLKFWGTPKSFIFRELPWIFHEIHHPFGDIWGYPHDYGNPNGMGTLVAPLWYCTWSAPSRPKPEREMFESNHTIGYNWYISSTIWVQIFGD